MAEQSEQEHTVPPPADVDVAAVEEEQAREREL